MSSPAPDRAVSSSMRVLLSLAAAVVVIAGLSFAREIVGPIALAIVIVIICDPVRTALARRGLPSWAGTTLVIVIAYVVLLGMGALMWFAGSEFARLVMNLTSDGDVQRQIAAFTSFLDDVGIGQEAADAITSLLSPANLLGLVQQVGGTVVSVATALFFVFAYIIFMAVDAARYRRAPAVFGASRGETITRIATLNRGIRRYYVVNAAFGAIVAIVDGLALWWMGVPAPIVWAILSFVTNFIPNIGFVLGLVPPAILAYAVGDWPLLLGVIAVYSVANVVLQVLVQPKFVSDAVDLSLTLSFFSVVFWTFVIGPLGAILSIPLTLLARSLILEPNPDALWLRWLSGDRDAVPPPEPVVVEQPVRRRRRRGLWRR